MFAILEKEYFFIGEIAAGFNVTLKTVKVWRQQTGILSGNISSFLHFK